MEVEITLSLFYCRYELEGTNDLLGSGVGCVVRSAPDSDALRRDQLECHAVNWQQCRYMLSELEDQVSSVICLKPTNSTRLVFDVSKSYSL